MLINSKIYNEKAPPQTVRVGDTIWTVLLIAAASPLATALSVSESAEGVLLDGLRTFELQPHRTVHLSPSYNYTLLVELDTRAGESDSALLNGNLSSQFLGDEFNVTFPPHLNATSLNFSFRSLGGSFSCAERSGECNLFNCSLEMFCDSALESVVLELNHSAREISVSVGNETLYSRRWLFPSEKRGKVSFQDASPGARFELPLNVTGEVRCTNSTGAEVPCWRGWEGRSSCSLSDVLDWKGDGRTDVDVYREWRDYEPTFRAERVEAAVCTYDTNIQPNNFKCTIAGVEKTAEVDTTAHYACAVLSWDEPAVLRHVEENPSAVRLSNCGSRGDDLEFLPIWSFSDCALDSDRYDHYYDIRLSVDYETELGGMAIAPQSGGDHYVYFGNLTSSSAEPALFERVEAPNWTAEEESVEEQLLLNATPALNASAAPSFNISGNGSASYRATLCQEAVENATVWADGEPVWERELFTGNASLFLGPVRELSFTQSGRAPVNLTSLSFRFKEVARDVSFSNLTFLPLISSPLNFTLPSPNVTHNSSFPLLITSWINASRSWEAEPFSRREGGSLFNSLFLFFPLSAREKTVSFEIEENSTSRESGAPFLWRDGKVTLFPNSSALFFNWTFSLPAVEEERDERPRPMAAEEKSGRSGSFSFDLAAEERELEEKSPDPERRDFDPPKPVGSESISRRLEGMRLEDGEQDVQAEESDKARQAPVRESERPENVTSESGSPGKAAFPLLFLVALTFLLKSWSG